MTITRKRLLLSYLAAVLFEKGEYFVSLSKLEEIVAAFLKNIPEVDAGKLRDEAAGVIAAIEAHHGILVEQARDVHSFSHLTFQEYFAANYVQGSNDSQKNLVDKYLGEIRWREVIILTAILLSQADDYVVGILNKMESAFGFRGYDLSRLREFLDQTRARMSRGGIVLESVSTKTGFSFPPSPPIETAIKLIYQNKAYLTGTDAKAERELRRITAAETLVEILQSSAYICEQTRSTAIRTILSGWPVVRRA